tara:strand:- start:405 stop:659 length:255 start_codon:yes stop_codon:yes gene_type:complete
MVNLNWTVYILECADKSLYTGITTNLSRRLGEHRAGRGAKYVKGRGPFKLVYYEKHRSRSRASKRELEIKAFNRAKKLRLIFDK